MGICPIAEILKNCSPTQNFSEIGKSAAELWPKTIFSMAAVRHLEFYGSKNGFATRERRLNKSKHRGINNNS